MLPERWICARSLDGLAMLHIGTITDLPGHKLEVLVALLGVIGQLAAMLSRPSTDLLPVRLNYTIVSSHPER